MKYYYTSNMYLSNIINDYFNKKKKWKKKKNKKYVNYADLNYTNKDYKCNNCKIINQFDNIDLLGNKIFQYNNFIKFYGIKPYFIPITYKLNISNLNNYHKLFHNNKKWIIKPTNSLSRNGIKVVNNLNILKKWITLNNKWDEWLIQEYINNPLLLNGRKFHFRVYVILIKNNKKIQIFMYHKGFMYTANTKYNNSIDNNTTLSGENNKNNIYLFPDDFIKHFGVISYYKYIIPQFKKIIKRCIYPVIDTIQCPNKNINNYKCFKLLGFDILIDKNYKLYLAEINARNISYKYPPKNFLNIFYSNVLNLILKKKRKNFIFIAQIYNTNLIYILYVIILIIILIILLLLNNKK